MKLVKQVSGVFATRPILIDPLECPDFLHGLAERFWDAALARLGDAIEPPDVATSLMAMSNRLREMANDAQNRVEDGTSQWRRLPRADAQALCQALRQAYAA